MRRPIFNTCGKACGIAASAFLLTAFAPQPQILEYPAPEIREQQTVVVGGVAETWQLKWTSKPKPVCEPTKDSLTCPCTGFAYGEGGDMVLVRLRNQSEIDRLHLSPFFEESLIVQRWAPDDSKDFEASKKGDFPELVSQRPIVQVMHFADYDHDGQSTEFYLQLTTAPCGHRIGAVMGVSKRNPRLHVFGTASQADKPLLLEGGQWDALRRARGPIEVPDIACGDHASETGTTVQLRWTPNGIDGTRRTFTCPPNVRLLLEEKPL